MALKVGELYGQLTMDSSPFDKSVDGVKSKFGGLGKVAAGAIGGAVVGAVAALGGAMIAGVKSADDFKKAMNGLQTATGSTKEETKQMGEAMKEIYSNNYGDSFDDIGKTMQFAKQATGATGEELKKLTQNALMLRDTFEMDVTESLRGSDSMMEQFGFNGEKAMALIVEATQKGLNKNGDLVDSIEEYSVYYKNAGLSAEDMFASFENASKSGVRNLDLVGDSMKEFSIIMKEDGDKASNALNGLGLDADGLRAQFAKGGDGAKQAFQTITEELGKIEDPLERNKYGVELFGTKFEDLEADAVLAMGNLNGTIKGSAETLKSINEIKYDSFGEAMAGIGRQLTVGLLMPLGEKILPLLNDFANWISDHIPAIISYFTNLGNMAVAAFQMFGPEIEAAKTFLQNLGEKVVEVFNRFAPSIQQASGFITTLKETFVSNFQTIMGVVIPIISFIVEQFVSLFGSVLAWWQTNGAELLANFQIVFNAIWGVIQFIMPAILFIIKTVFENVKGVVIGALNIIMGVFQIFAGLLTGNWSKMWDGVKNLLKGALQFIWNLWNLLLFGKLLTGIKMLGTKSIGLFKSMWSGIKNGFGAFVGFIQRLIIKLVTGAVSKLTSFGSKFASIFNTMRAFGVKIWSAIWQTIRNLIQDGVSMAKNKISSMKNAIVDKFNLIKSKATSIFNSVKKAITDPIESAKKTVTGIIEKIKNAFSKLKITIPKPKIPKISIGSKKGLFGAPIPTFDIGWYKTGGIATGPAIAGIGEAGSEAIVPLSGSRMRPFAEETAKQMAKATGGQNIGNGGAQPIVVMIEVDGEKIAKATAKPMRSQIKTLEEDENRGKGKRKL